LHYHRSVHLFGMRRGRRGRAAGGVICKCLNRPDGHVTDASTKESSWKPEDVTRTSSSCGRGRRGFLQTARYARLRRTRKLLGRLQLRSSRHPGSFCAARGYRRIPRAAILLVEISIVSVCPVSSIQFPFPIRVYTDGSPFALPSVIIFSVP